MSLCRQKDEERRREDAQKREREVQKSVQRKQAYEQVNFCNVTYLVSNKLAMFTATY